MRHHHRLMWASCDEPSNRADSAHTNIRKTRVFMVSSSVAGTLIGAPENTLSLSPLLGVVFLLLFSTLFRT